MTNGKDIREFYLILAIPLSYLLGLGLIVVGSGQVKTPFEIRVLGLVLSCFGLAFWFLSYWFLGKDFAVLPQPKKAVKRGIYRWFSHPMYLGIFGTFLGLAVAEESGFGLAYCLVFLGPLLLVRAYLETKLLFK